MKLLKGKNPMGAVGTVRSFMNVVKDIDFDEVRDRAEQAPRTLIVATSEALSEDAVGQLFGAGSRDGIERRTWRDGDTVDVSRWDVIVVYDPEGQGLLDTVRKAIGPGADAVVFFLAGPGQSARNAVDALRAEITSTLPALAPAFGRFYPEWRPDAVRAIIDETSKANAQFALVSNVSTVIPIVGNLMAVGADLIVLTKNQVMMCYKIAAAHDHDLGNQFAIIRELTPVVGAGFLWRTIAREATAMIPLAAGTIPKVAIAFAGTMAVGRAADYYYRFGSKPSKSQLAEFRKSALQLASKLPVIGDDALAAGMKGSKGKETTTTRPLDATATSTTETETQPLDRD